MTVYGAGYWRLSGSAAFMFYGDCWKGHCSPAKEAAAFWEFLQLRLGPNFVDTTDPAVDILCGTVFVETVRAAREFFALRNTEVTEKELLAAIAAAIHTGWHGLPR